MEMMTVRRESDSTTALLLIDVINDLDFPEADALLHYALPAALQIRGLKKRAKAFGAPIIYVNDNFGRWRSDFRQQIEHCLRIESKGREIAKFLRPDEDDYFVLKPRHSGFYSTSLDVLLKQLQIKRLMLTGFSTEICVIYTANDAYMRGFEVAVPADCVAAESQEASLRALEQMERFLKADIRISAEIQFT
jgi:nicotinamidase-related amidase